jgi:hypothetical protein
MRWLTWNGLNNRIMFGEIIVPYIIGGSLFGLLFELLVNKMSDEDREPTRMWERIFWITCWPYCLTIFLYNMFKKD